MRGKKPFLAVFAGIGIVSTALLVLVGSGDWVMASVFGILGRIGFNGANSFYDALLPHVAREDHDRVNVARAVRSRCGACWDWLDRLCGS